MADASDVRLLALSRFAVYTVILALGGLHLAPRVASGSLIHPEGMPEAHLSGDHVTSLPTPHYLSGRTSQGESALAMVQGRRVLAVMLGWSGRCHDGSTRSGDAGGFRDAFAGDFERHGRRFEDHYTSKGLNAHLTGEESGDGKSARGTARFARAAQPGYPGCSSGPIAWSVTRGK